MKEYNTHLIDSVCSAREALQKLEYLPDSASRTLFVTESSNLMIGTITDGDIRRGLLDGLEISQGIIQFMNKKFKYLTQDEDHLDKIRLFKKAAIDIVPVLDKDNKIINLIDLKRTKTLIPASALIMAGGRGERLRPFTDSIPKPMLLVGGKPIIEHNIDRLISFGINEIYISVNYLKEAIINYFGNGSEKGIIIKYIEEEQPLGTLGALTLVESFVHDDILVMNSDLLTNIDLEDFYRFYKDSQASMCLASIPYIVKIPYAVLETHHQVIKAFTEKPTYTYYSNGGIYLLKKQLKDKLRYNDFLNATDLMNLIISENGVLTHYPLLNYWLDIGRYEDFIKAQEDVNHILF
jgi:dTDP-glucose pyrophosphorylase